MKQIFVAIGLMAHADRVLLGRRYAPSVPEYHNHWELPGGKIEFGESLESAVERELREETGHVVSCSALIPFSYCPVLGGPSEQRSHIIVVASVCKLLREEPVRRRGKDASIEVRWFNYKEIPFDQLIPGSREFLLWWLAQEGCPYPSPAPEYQVILLWDSGSDAQRFRRCELVLRYAPKRELPFEVIISSSHGTGHPTRSEKRFRRMEEAVRCVRQDLESRARKGYKVFHMTETHPLRSWVNSIGIERWRTDYHPRILISGQAEESVEL